MLVTAKWIEDEALRQGGFAVIAPNANVEFYARAAVEAAEECHTAVILDINYPQIEDMVGYGRLLERIAMESSAPVAIQQDHGGTFEQAIWAIRSGYSAVMADRSDKPYEQNVAEVSEIVKIAHAVGVSVEGEIGHVGMNEDAESIASGLVDPDNAKDYAERTGVDALAVAIGTTHGTYKGTPHLDFDLLARCREAVDIPLVLHGASGTGDELLAKAARSGIQKINVCTELQENSARYWNEAGITDAGHGFRLLRKGYKEKVVHYMHVFGQVNKF